MSRTVASKSVITNAFVQLLICCCVFSYFSRLEALDTVDTVASAHLEGLVAMVDLAVVMVDLAAVMAVDLVVDFSKEALKQCTVISKCGAFFALDYFIFTREDIFCNMQNIF